MWFPASKVVGLASKRTLLETQVESDGTNLFT